MGVIVKQKDLDDHLREEGFVVFPILSKDAVSELLSFYNKLHPDTPSEMSASAHSPDIEYRKMVNEKIIEIIRPKIEEYLAPIQVLGGSFITKGNSQDATLPPHQDWNIVEEDRFRSFNLWIPLVDTDRDNGGICVLPGSHLFLETYRGPDISSAFEHVNEELWPYLKFLDIPAGHGLLYDHRLLHASDINKTEQPRIVVVVGIIEQGAEMKIYYRNKESVDVYNCNPSFFMEKDPNKGPAELVLEKSFPWHFPSIQSRDLKKMLKGYKAPKNLIVRLLEKFVKTVKN